MPTVNFENEHRSLDVLPGTNLRRAALQSGIRLYSPLRRVFHINVRIGPLVIPCGADVVEVSDGKGTNPRSEREELIVQGRMVKRKTSPAHRLACLVDVEGDITVRTSPHREIDIQATKEHLGFLAIVGAFVLVMAGILGVIALDLLKVL